jgi:hypothetical protein
MSVASRTLAVEVTMAVLSPELEAMLGKSVRPVLQRRSGIQPLELAIYFVLAPSDTLGWCGAVCMCLCKT